MVRQVYAPDSEVLGHGVLLCLWSLDYLAAQLRIAFASSIGLGVPSAP